MVEMEGRKGKGWGGNSEGLGCVEWEKAGEGIGGGRGRDGGTRRCLATPDTPANLHYKMSQHVNPVSIHPSVQSGWGLCHQPIRSVPSGTGQDEE